MKTPKKPTIQQLRKKYTRVVKIADKWNTYLQIDHQGFCVVQQTTEKRAKWYAMQLAIALYRMLENESRHPQTRTNT